MVIPYTLKFEYVIWKKFRVKSIKKCLNGQIIKALFSSFFLIIVEK